MELVLFSLVRHMSTVKGILKSVETKTTKEH